MLKNVSLEVVIFPNFKDCQPKTRIKNNNTKKFLNFDLLNENIKRSVIGKTINMKG